MKTSSATHTHPISILSNRKRRVHGGQNGQEAFWVYDRMVDATLVIEFAVGCEVLEGAFYLTYLTLSYLIK